jgi:hypothetical protein
MKLTTPLLAISTILLSSTSFSYVSGKMPQTPSLIYCPSQINCTEAKNPNSCTYDKTYEEYWWHIGGSGTGEDPPVAGTYNLANVAAGYHWAQPGTAVMCIYENHDSGVSNVIALYAKFESNLEAYYDKNTKWEINIEPYPSYCRTNQPQSCPLIEQSALEIFNGYAKEGLLAFANNIQIVDTPIQPTFGKVIYDNALTGCGSSNECTIDITTVNRVKLASILVDMDNRMKILKISAVQSSGAEIAQISPFNTIEIKKSDSPPTVPSIELYNYIHSGIIATGLATPIAEQSHDKIFYDRLISYCNNSKECTIDIKTAKGGVIGSLIVDMENQMNILNVNSLRPSEIVINRIDNNKIEIRYPNLNKK